jgi:hypothetical protein
VLLLSYHADTHLISFRHYTISVRPHGVSRRVRKLLSGATSSKPIKSSRKVDLGSTEDIADFLLRRQRGGSSAPSEGTSAASTAGYDSTSETEASEAESDSNAVELPDDYLGRGNKKGERKAVRLVEVGPRLELKLIKVVEGLVGSKKGEGETVFHEFGECERLSSIVVVIVGNTTLNESGVFISIQHSPQIKSRCQQASSRSRRSSKGKGRTSSRARSQRRAESPSQGCQGGRWRGCCGRV